MIPVYQENLTCNIFYNNKKTNSYYTIALHTYVYKNLYRTGFIFRRPLLSTVKNIFTLPFHRNVWIALGVFLLLVFCSLYLSIKWEYYRGILSKSAIHWNQMNSSKPTISDNFLILLGAFAQQGRQQ